MRLPDDELQLPHTFEDLAREANNCPFVRAFMQLHRDGMEERQMLIELALTLSRTAQGLRASSFRSSPAINMQAARLLSTTRPNP